MTIWSRQVVLVITNVRLGQVSNSITDYISHSKKHQFLSFGCIHARQNGYTPLLLLWNSVRHGFSFVERFDGGGRRFV